MNLKHLVSDLENKIPEVDVFSQRVSNGSVYWHLFHTFKTISMIVSAIEASEIEEYKPCFNIKKHFVLLGKMIPKKKFKAPSKVTPPENVSKEEVLNELSKAKHQMQKLDNFDAQKFFNHPHLGQMNVKETQKFLYIHSSHHKQIIENIVKFA